MMKNQLVRYFVKVLCLGFLATCQLFSCANAADRHFPAGTQAVTMSDAPGFRSDLLQNIAPIVENSIQNGSYPGAVILISHRGKIVYQGVFGSRRIVPDVAPMQLDTIFDLASLTKVVATTPAVMQLVEQGKIELDAPVAKYWPEFAKQGKDKITIRELLTHTSGLPEDFAKDPAPQTEAALLSKIAAMTVKQPAGKSFDYSDLNFVVLAHLVEIISHEPINQYAANHVFKPLAMADTTYLPNASLRDRIAPTEVNQNDVRWGTPQDPVAHALGGVSGNAGVFSTAPDLAKFAQALLNGGALPRPYQAGSQTLTNFLGPLTIEKMTTVQTPKDMPTARGLGWDIDSPYSNRGVLFPLHSYGHTGYTGTSIWIDPVSQTFIIILTSRTHPTAAAHNQLIDDRRAIADIVSASVTDVPAYGFNNTGVGELSRAYHT